MKSNARRVSILALSLMISTAIILIAADSSSSQPASLTVHEWGTFTSVAGADGSAIDWDSLRCSDDLPHFVQAEKYRGFKWTLRGTVRMETPVMYFYSPHEITAQAKVFFPNGVITEWYPNGDTAIYESKALMDRMSASLDNLRSSSQSRLYSDEAAYKTASLLPHPPAGLDPELVRLGKSLSGIDTSLRQLMGSIGWSDIRIQPGSNASFPMENGPGRYYAARETDAAPVTVGDQHEKFLFYRGVGNFQVPIWARALNDGKVTVENRGADSIPTVILFEHRGGRIGFRNIGALEPGALDKSPVMLDRPSLDGSLSQLLYDLESSLAAQGLYPREAQAMVETWKDSWFEEGSRLIYIVPSHAIDSILPLQVKPAPLQTARVFVGRVELITPETKRGVEQAVAKNDWAAINKYGRFLEPILERIKADASVSPKQGQEFQWNTQRVIGSAHCP